MESQTSANPKLQDIKDQSYNMINSKQVLVVFYIKMEERNGNGYASRGLL
jgi:hypothetical protein